MSDDASMGPQWTELMTTRRNEGSEGAGEFIAVKANQGAYTPVHATTVWNDVRGFKQFRVTSKTPWEIKTSLPQWNALLTRWIEQVNEAAKVRQGPDAGRLAHSTLTAEAAEEWWTSHLTSDAVRVATLVFYALFRQKWVAQGLPRSGSSTILPRNGS